MCANIECVGTPNISFASGSCAFLFIHETCTARRHHPPRARGHVRVYTWLTQEQKRKISAAVSRKSRIRPRGRYLGELAEHTSCGIAAARPANGPTHRAARPLDGRQHRTAAAAAAARLRRVAPAQQREQSFCFDFSTKAFVSTRCSKRKSNAGLVGGGGSHGTGTDADRSGNMEPRLPTGGARRRGKQSQSLATLPQR